MPRPSNRVDFEFVKSPVPSDEEKKLIELYNPPLPSSPQYPKNVYKEK
jgi:hypothetical protein